MRPGRLVHGKISRMVKLSVMYPATPGSRFDWDYYLGKHRELSQRLLSSGGLLRTEIDKVVGGFPPGTPPTYHAVGHLYFRSVEEMEVALAATAAEFIADEANYTSSRSVVQVSEVID